MANSQQTKNPLSPTSNAMVSSLPKIISGGSHCGIISSAIRVSARNGRNTKFIGESPQPFGAALKEQPQRGERSYQLDFVTPGMSPPEASSRKVRREILKRRIKARRRPVTSQRFTTRLGLASRGSWE